MAVTRIRLKQLDSEIIEHFHEIVRSHSASLQLKDPVRKFKIEFTSPIELPKPIKDSTPVNKFKVMDLDDKFVLGYRDSMEEAIELFKQSHPYFDDDSIKTFIYELDKSTTP